MDSEQTYQPKYIWKYTTKDGMLPVTNFTEEISQEQLRRKGKAAEKDKEIGQVTEFHSNEEGEVKKPQNLSNGMYVYVNSLSKFGIIKSKKADNVLLLKVRKQNAKEEFDEVEVVNKEEEILQEVEVSVRVILSEDKKLSLII